MWDVNSRLHNQGLCWVVEEVTIGHPEAANLHDLIGRRKVLRHHDVVLHIAVHYTDDDTGREAQHWVRVASAMFVGFYKDCHAHLCMAVQCTFDQDAGVQNDIYLLYNRGFVPNYDDLPVFVPADDDVGTRWHLADSDPGGLFDYVDTFVHD